VAPGNNLKRNILAIDRKELIRTVRVEYFKRIGKGKI